jgi:hypothetical protein
MAKGFYTLDGVDWREVWDGYLLKGIDRYNEVDETDLAALLCVKDDEVRKKYLVRTTNTFQQLAHGERPELRKGQTGAFQKLTEKFGTEVGYDFDLLKDMKFQDILDYHAGILEQDRENIRNEILKAMLYSSTDGFYNGSFESDEGITKPPDYGQNTFLAAHTHYISTSEDTILLTEAADWRKHLREHGHKGRYIGFVNSDNATDVTKMLVPTSSDVKISNPLTDFVSVEGYIAKSAGIEWLETELMPSGYVLVVSTDINSNRGKPTKLIHPTNESYRGLKLVQGGNGEYPIIDSYYLRWLGAKVLARGAGIAIKLDSNSWSNPSL